jgi:hypothetical protein
MSIKAEATATMAESPVATQTFTRPKLSLGIVMPITYNSSTDMLSWTAPAGAQKYYWEIKASATAAPIIVAEGWMGTTFNIGIDVDHTVNLTRGTPWIMSIKAEATATMAESPVATQTFTRPKLSLGIVSGLNYDPLLEKIKWSAVSGAVAYAWDIKPAANSSAAPVATNTNHMGLEIDIPASLAYDNGILRDAPYVLSIKALATATRTEGSPVTLSFKRNVLVPPVQILAPVLSVNTTTNMGQATINFTPIAATLVDTIKLNVILPSPTPAVVYTITGTVLASGVVAIVNTGMHGQTFSYTMQTFMGSVAGPTVGSQVYTNLPAIPANVTPITTTVGPDVTANAIVFKWTAVPTATSYLVRVNPGASQRDIPVTTGTTTTWIVTPAYTSTVPVVFHLFAANGSGYGAPHIGSFTPVLASLQRYASITASQAVTESVTSNRINYVVDPMAGRNMYAATGALRTSGPTTMGSSIRKPFLMPATVSTLTPKPNVIRTNRVTNLCLSDVPGKRVTPLNGASYTKMVLFMVLQDADWAGNTGTLFSDWDNGGHMIQYQSNTTVVTGSPTNGYFFTSMNGGVNNAMLWKYKFVHNRWHCMFVTYTTGTGAVQMYANSATPLTIAPAFGSTAIPPNTTFGTHLVTDASDCGLGDLVGAPGWGITADFLEAATWNAVLTPTQIQNEMTRLSTLYGIVLPPFSVASSLPLQGTVETGSNRDVMALADGSPSTFYDALAPSGQWVGYNFGTPKAMTQLKFMPRATFAYRMVGGVFQASDGPSFTNVVDVLHTVTVSPAEGVYTVVTIGNQTAQYQYVRYVSPTNGFCNISEMDFVFV